MRNEMQMQKKNASLSTQMVADDCSSNIPDLAKTPEGNPACELFASWVGSEQVLSEELWGQRDHACA
ncbi:uncharacterized [Tachysurus ichikawai]